MLVPVVSMACDGLTVLVCDMACSGDAQLVASAMYAATIDFAKTVLAGIVVAVEKS